MTICYHGTDPCNFDSIMREGFRYDTWFAAHLEDAIAFGGLLVFEVAFDDPPDGWQFHCPFVVRADQIVRVTRFSDEVVYRNDELCNMFIGQKLGRPADGGWQFKPDSGGAWITPPITESARGSD